MLYGEKTQLTGGILWTWWHLLNGSLFHTEGLWINIRLVIFQFAQIVVGVVFGAFLLLSVESLADAAESEREKLGPEVPQWVRDLIPTRKMINWSLYPATFVALAVMLLLILIYIPRCVEGVDVLLQYHLAHLLVLFWQRCVDDIEVQVSVDTFARFTILPKTQGCS